jgi:hypothetical protein
MRHRNAALGLSFITAALFAASGTLAPPTEAAERVVLMEGFVVTC